jgi:hypothetical protein
MKSIWNNVILLYFVFIFALINLGWFLYKKDKESLIVFLTFSLVIYLINKNMIFVLGIPIIIANIYSFFKKEGFEDENGEKVDNPTEKFEDETDEKDKKSEQVENENSTGKSTGKSTENFEEIEENDYMQNKTIIKKLKELNPIVLDTLHKMSSVDIEELNKTINTFTSTIDP